MPSAPTQAPLGHSVRPHFPILGESVRGKPLVYLDNAATAQKPRAVMEALDEYWERVNANVHRGVHHLSQRATDLFESSRETVRAFVNAREVAEVVFTKGCTEGINLVATCLERAGGAGPLPKIGEGDTILLSTMEHHSNIVPWQILAERTGAKVVPIPITDTGEIDLDAYERQLREHRVKVLGVVHVSNSIGTINPVKRMVAMAHEVGAIAVVDGAQGGPHLRVDVQDLDADFYTLSCHKIYAPTGIGVLYGKRPLLEAMPPYQGGGGMIRSVSFEKTAYAEIPDKFEPGTPNVAGVIGLAAAMRWLETLGAHDASDRLGAAMEAIHAHEVELTARATDLLREIPGVRLIGEARHRAGIVSFVMDCAHPHDVGTILDSEGIAVRAGHHCCMPLMKRMGVPATARASFALYNTLEEAEALARGVKKVREIFG